MVHWGGDHRGPVGSGVDPLSEAPQANRQAAWTAPQAAALAWHGAVGRKREKP